MDADRFEDLQRALSVAPSRRGIARALAGLVAVGPLSALLGSADADAKKKRKKKNKCKGRKCGKKCFPKSACCSDEDCENDGGTCVNNACACPEGQDACGGSCLASCPTRRARNPNTCECCRPSDDLSRICDSDPCCSGLECDQIAEDASQCEGRGLGDPCSFDEQCETGFSCNSNQVCA